MLWLPFAILAPAAHSAEEVHGTSDVMADASDGTDSLPGVTVTGKRDASDRQEFPATSASVDREQMAATVNSMDVEDAAKYLPSIFIRKRNYGDTQPVLATRDWGVNSSARTLVYVDDIPISALIANNNTIGAPRWGMVSPEQIERIDMLYGPYSSEYSGNSMGGVMRIITRSPGETEFTFDQTNAVQSFSLYDTDNHFSTSQTSATAGGREGDLTWFVAGNFQNSFSQPLTFITTSAIPAGTSGAVPANNKLGQTADVLGAGGLLHTREANVLAQVGYDLTPAWRLTYLADFWRNDADSGISTYLTDATGQPTFGHTAGFASNDYQLLENHLMNGVSLKSDTRASWDGEAVATCYNFLQDRQVSPAGVVGGTMFTTNGRLADYGGTQWGTLDLKGTWRPFGYGGPDSLSFGGHVDRYTLNNPTYNTTSWPDRQTAAGIYSSGRGRTQTEALWVQNVWTIDTDWQATIGARAEHWRAYDGYNFSGKVGVNQPTESANGFSPTVTLSWHTSDNWTVTGSLAHVVRFPTVGELYQLVSTGSTYTSPNPDLEPERDLIGEIAVERAIQQGSVRVSFFQENTRDVLTSQTATLAAYPVPVTYVVNVGEVRNRGVELAGQRADLGLPGFGLEASVTFVDSTTLADGNFVSTTGTTALGKHAPYVPRWRATLVATYRPTPRWALTVAGRYSGQMYSTIDNTDNTPHVFGAFDSFLVFDARAHYDVTDHLTASLGVDNLTDRKYFLYHPFPQRTLVGELRLKF